MAPQISLQQKNAFQSIKLQFNNKKGKHIGSLTKKLMECYKIHTPSQSCPVMSMTEFYFHLLGAPHEQTTSPVVLQASQYCEHSSSAGKIIKQQEREKG